MNKWFYLHDYCQWRHHDVGLVEQIALFATEHSICKKNVFLVLFVGTRAIELSVHHNSQRYLNAEKMNGTLLWFRETKTVRIKFALHFHSALISDYAGVNRSWNEYCQQGNSSSSQKNENTFYKQFYCPHACFGTDGRETELPTTRNKLSQKFIRINILRELGTYYVECFETIDATHDTFV